MNPTVPTGSSSAVVQQYYDYLFRHYIGGWTQTYSVDWGPLVVIGLWLILLAGGLFAFLALQPGTRAPREPYPLESYNGYIAETNGPVGPFLLLFFGAVVVWLVSFTITELTYGSIY